MAFVSFSEKRKERILIIFFNIEKYYKLVAIR